MAPAAVRFHPAAAQEAESAYQWYAARNPAAAHGFLEELRHAVALPRTHVLGPATETALGSTSSLDSPSA